MAEFTDDQMRALLPTTRPYTVVILKAGPNHDMEGAQAIVWEHGRRNFSLRDEGGDPGVRAGVFVYEIHPSRGFPGDSLPG